ncbi:PAS domain-containing protein [Pseudovibrio sp. Alg231-02]|uniref:PAS domain-containing protein n=1 Tax=Pseudovibrio sp. Alg231-02 TaxID=1922223 RepID=UPI000D55E398|nr:PAS domain-containing protein [Pseudovibrio sp. Alg231-02]
MTDNKSELPEVTEQRILEAWRLSGWADRLLEEAGIGVTIIDKDGKLLYYNKWASENLDRQPRHIGHIGHNVKKNHRRAITNPRFDAMLQLFKDGRKDPVRYVANPYGTTPILVTVSPIHIDGELVGFSQFVLLKEEVQDLCCLYDQHGRDPFEKAMLPDS